MAVIVNSTVKILDCAIGPVSVTTSDVTDFDIDDFVHFVTINQAEQLKFYQAASRADPDIAKNRIPVIVGNVAIGGYKP